MTAFEQVEWILNRAVTAPQPMRAITGIPRR
jgi:hypothetical protein